MKRLFTLLCIALSGSLFAQNLGTSIFGGHPVTPLVKKEGKKLYSHLKQGTAVTSAFCKPKVLLACASPYTSDVQSRLLATGLFSAVDIFDAMNGTPSLSTLQMYDAVMVFTDYGPQDGTTFGNNLASYIDAGGGVVSTVFDNASIPIGGNFNTNTYRALLPASQTQGVPRTLGTVLIPGHPLMSGVVTFNAGTSSYKSTSTSLAPGAYNVSLFDDGTPLVTAKENVGPMNARRVDLDFYPPSFNIRNDFWDVNTDGDELMVNALYWVCQSDLSGLTNDTMCANGPAFTLTGGYPAGGTYSGNGVSSGMFDPAVAGPGTHTIYYVHTNVSGCADTATHVIVVNLCTDIKEQMNDLLVNVMPNPSQGQFNVSINAEGLSTISLNVLDVQGRVVYSTGKLNVSNSFSKTLSLETLSSGVYSLQVISNLGASTRKIVIQN